MFGWVLIIVFVFLPGMIGLVILLRGAQLGLRHRRQAVANLPQRQEAARFEKRGIATGRVHTVYRDEKWINEVEGEGALPGAFKTKAEAMLTGRTHAVYGQTEHVIHNMDGTIGERSSFGDEPASRPSMTEPEPTAARASQAPEQTARPQARATDRRAPPNAPGTDGRRASSKGMWNPWTFVCCQVAGKHEDSRSP